MVLVQLVCVCGGGGCDEMHSHLSVTEEGEGVGGSRTAYGMLQVCRGALQVVTRCAVRDCQ